jgi:hypothetical protein
VGTAVDRRPWRLALGLLLATLWVGTTWLGIDFVVFSVSLYNVFAEVGELPERYEGISRFIGAGHGLVIWFVMFVLIIGPVLFVYAITERKDTTEHETVGMPD